MFAHLGSLGFQIVEQRLRVLQVGGVESLGEPVVNIGEHGARFVAAIGVAQQPGEAHGGAQFPPFAALLPFDRDSFFEPLFRRHQIGSAAQNRFRCYAMQFWFGPTLPGFFQNLESSWSIVR